MIKSLYYNNHSKWPENRSVTLVSLYFVKLIIYSEDYVAVQIVCRELAREVKEVVKIENVVHGS